MDPRSKYATWVEVDLLAIEGNARALSDMSKAQLMAVVKANGYGHGAVETARAAAKGGATWLGVARPDEALELRSAGFDHPILVLGPAPEDSLEWLIGEDVSLTVCDADHISAADRAGKSLDLTPKVHLKVDTGMSRLGAKPEEAVALARSIQEEYSLAFEGIFTHFACADEVQNPANKDQVERFGQALSKLDESDLRPPLVHAANSAALFSIPEVHFDIVRVGIALYGLQPSKEWSLPEAFRPALQWKSQLTRVRTLPPGSGVSYGHVYVTETEERIGTVPVGYADGLRRAEGNRVLVGGEQAPVVGRVCMDLSMIQLDNAPEVAAGDEIVLIGEQEGTWITAEQVADNWGTINYEVTCSIGRRVPRISRSDD